MSASRTWLAPRSVVLPEVKASILDMSIDLPAIRLQWLGRISA